MKIRSALLGMALAASVLAPTQASAAPTVGNCWKGQTYNMISMQGEDVDLGAVFSQDVLPTFTVKRCNVPTHDGQVRIEMSTANTEAEVKQLYADTVSMKDSFTTWLFCAKSDDRAYSVNWRGQTQAKFRPRRSESILYNFWAEGYAHYKGCKIV